MSKLLRHDPEGLKMDDEGYVRVSDLLHKLNLKRSELDWIVDNNDKKRFHYDESKTLIRAAQGHSAGIAPKLQYARLTASQGDLKIYHGTDAGTFELIKQTGLKPMNRSHVHWTGNLELANKRSIQKAGANHSKPVIIELDKTFLHDSNIIYIAENGVYLTDHVDPKYLKVIENTVD